MIDLDKGSHPLFLLMKSTQCVETDLMDKMKHQEE